MKAATLLRPHLFFVGALLGLSLLGGGCGGGNDPSETAVGGASPGVGGMNNTGGGLSEVGGASVGGAPSGVGGMNNTGGGLSEVGGASVGGAPPGVGGMPCAEPVSGATDHDNGCYDTHGCDTIRCHGENKGFSGGWLYNNLAGDYWIADATVTVTDNDGRVVTTTSATDGFFSLIGYDNQLGTITVPYVPCVSKCPGVACGTKAIHTTLDCQTADCHGAANRRVYVPGQDVGAGGTGPTDPNCVPPTLGGARAHYVPGLYDYKCDKCHDIDQYNGGFVYDGVASVQTVAEATVTVTTTGGTTRTAVTGPGGLFSFPGVITPPYTACVSKCPSSTVCSPDTTHTTAQYCRECHTATQRIHIP
jgi:hypothetical protein